MKIIKKFSIFLLLLIIAELNSAWLAGNGFDDVLENGLTITHSSRASVVSKKNHKHRKNPKINNNSNKRISHRNTYRSEDSEYSQIQAVNVTAKVGESVVLNCIISSTYGANPGVIWMQGKLGNVLTLNTDRITADSRFEISQQPLNLPEADQNTGNFIKRQSQINQPQQPQQPAQNELSFYHLKINNVQIYDENEYACQTSSTKSPDDPPHLHSLVHLHVIQSPGFIEAMTSGSNIAALENGEVILKCHAVGKPEPKIRWYQIFENSGQLKDLNHESTTLTLRNISKHDSSKYECVAENGILPSVSKKFTLTVYYVPIVVAAKSLVSQYQAQSALLGCTVFSNPESSVVWYRKVPSSNESTFEKIDVSHSKYQVLKYRQTNQTLSYLKIKNLEMPDYSKYKCEAVNLVGKSEALIELQELQKEIETSASTPQPPSTRHKLKTTKRLNNISFVSVHKETTEEMFNEAESEMDADGSEVEDERKSQSVNSNEVKIKQVLNPNLRKKPTPKQLRMHNNKTIFKYQINKSNRVIESENSLQRINDLSLPSGSVPTRPIISLLTSTVLLLNLFKYIY